MTETVETVIARAIFSAQFTEQQLASIGMTGATSSPYTEQLATAVAAALDAAGYAVLPKEPTNPMVRAGRNADDAPGLFSARRIYRAMLAAARAPSP